MIILNGDVLMCKFIGIEDLAANALIELIEGKDCNKVSFEQLINYGNVIVKLLDKLNEEVVLLISNDYTNEVIRNYSDFFRIEKENNEEYFALKNEKSVDDLRLYFRACLTLDLLTAFTDQESLNEIGVCA